MREKYIRGGVAYGDIKQQLFELLDSRFSEAREKYYELSRQPKQIDLILDEGAQKARHIAQHNLNRIR